MTSLKRNLNWFFLVIFVIGSVVLAWGLHLQWRGIVERHEIRQTSQITTIGNATEAVLHSQETLLSLIGGQLILHWRMDQLGAVEMTLDSMLDTNQTAVGYALLDPTQSLIVARWRERLPQAQAQPTRSAGSATCEAAESAQTMIVGRAYRVDSMERWLIPVCQAIHGATGKLTGFVAASLALGGPDSFFAEQAALGRSNVVQVVRESDLSSLLWATALDLPAEYLARPVSREVYDQAIASAVQLSGQSFEAIRSSGQPYPYRLKTALGPQMGMAMHEHRYGLWILTQTNRGELFDEFLRAAWIYVAIFLVALLSILVLLLAIDRAERRRRADLVYQAHHDMLTGLPNRQSVRARFELMQQRFGGEFTLMFVDMDNFKAVNDGFGHMQGDAVLRQLGSRLNQFAQAHEHVARVGGDEFVVMTPETDSQRLIARGEELVERLAQRYQVDGVTFELGCSVGIARLADAGSSLNDLLRAADVAMYSAKRHHNAASLYEPTMGRIYLENIQIEQRLRLALDGDLIHMAYQPQVDWQGRIVGVEALARWHDPELGEVGPARFVAIAETSGLIEKLGDYLMERCLEDARRITEQQSRPLLLAINISVRQFLQPEFPQQVIERLGELENSKITPMLEITENLFAEDHGSLTAGIKKLHRAGIRIALDDFGTGYSSLAMLRNLPIDELKIDKSFVDDLEARNGSRKLVQSILAIGRNHDMRVVAEGVETQRQFEILREEGCEVFQGFLAARPMSLEHLLERLSSGDQQYSD